MAEFAKNEFVWPGGGIALRTTLFCGQSFSWTDNGDNTFTGTAGGRAATVWEKNGLLYLRPLGENRPDDETFWLHYFALQEDYSNWSIRFCQDATLRKCVESSPGIRVLNQPFFDVLMSFIISQNNNIPRIAGIVERLRQQFGPSLAPGVWGFPAAHELAGLSPEDLAPLRVGFRAKYLVDAANKVATGQLREARLRQLSTDEARAELKQIYGVGDKVADCVLLFSLERKEVVPMDVWMRRAIQMYFGGQMPACAAGGEGIAQQYIFHWARTQDGVWEKEGP